MAQKIYVVVGPTASGKSDFAVQLAKEIRGEVISADSRQVYKGLDIGTGKITRKEMRGVPHHMLDVASPQKTYTAEDFAREARVVLIHILRCGKTPIICGGTGFYIDALLATEDFPKVPPNRKLRATLSKFSTERLFMLVQKKDPERAETIDPKNKVRLIRALEIVEALGKVPKRTVEYKKELHIPELKSVYTVKWIGLVPSKELLRKKIEARLQKRLDHGMLAEARQLHAPRTGRPLSYKRMEELGLEYRTMARYLQRKISRKEMEKEILTKIIQYAKRQMTYWKRNPHITWRKVAR